MKRIEIFEEGFFFTFLTEGGKTRISLSPCDRPYREDGGFDSLPLPLVRLDPPAEFGEAEYSDTGNQTGRTVTLSNVSSDGKISASLTFQFHKGKRCVMLTGRAESSSGSVKTGCFGLERLSGKAGEKYSSDITDGSCSVCESIVLYSSDFSEEGEKK